MLSGCDESAAACGPLPVRFVETGLVEPIDDALTDADRADYLPEIGNARRMWRRPQGKAVITKQGVFTAR